MTREETVKILSVLRGAYPQFYRDVSRQEALDTINLWADLFALDDSAIVSAAVKSVIEGDEKGFPPTIGQVKARMRLLTSRDETTEAEAWNRVAAAVKNGIYGAEEEFQKLPAECRRIVGDPAQLRQWAMMDADVVHSVVASNFQRSYRAVRARERELQKLPQEVRRKVEALGTGGGDSAPEKALPRYESEEETLRRMEEERKRLRAQLRARQGKET